MTERPLGPGPASAPPAQGCPTRRIVEWEPASAVDWPGHIAAVVRLGGCSFKCAFCDSAARDMTASQDDHWGALLSHLGERRRFLAGIVVTGGEPTDDPDLPSLLARLAEDGWAVRLDTNGSDPRALRHLLAEGLVTSVALDVKTTLDRYDALTGVVGSGERVRESIGLLKAADIDHEFRTTLFPGAVALDDLEPLAAELADGRVWALQQFRASGTLDRRAAAVQPYAAAAVQEYARACRRHIRVVLRGFSAS